jgi:hypothetical protein
MNFVDDFKKLKRVEIMHFSILFLALIASGFLLIYLYRIDLLISLSTLKLIIFSISLSSPIYILNYLLVAYHEDYEDKQKKAEKADTISMISSSFSFVIMNFTTLFAYLFDLSFKYYILSIFVIEIILFIIAYMDSLAKKKKLK